MKPIAIHLLTFTFSIFSISSLAVEFEDVSTFAGMRRPYGPRVKHGGPTVADLDGDGWVDVMVGHHDQYSADIYFNNRNGKFRRVGWKYWRDLHSLNAFRANPSSKGMNFVASIGGNNGKTPNSPSLFHVSPNRRIKHSMKLSFANGRGRTTVPISLRMTTIPQTSMVFYNAPLGTRTRNHHAGTAISNNAVRYDEIHGLVGMKNSNGMAIDVDMDGRMELISFQDLKVHKLVSDFHFKDITAKVLPYKKFYFAYQGITSVCEFDFNNDGKMDLFLTRSGTDDLIWLRPHITRNPPDYLLQNVGGKYRDVSKRAKIPELGESRGCTVGDFNNDGWEDVLVSKFTGPDVLLLNNGDGTFTNRHAGYHKRQNTRGDQPVAVDYDRNGFLDIILTEGHWFERSLGGYLRVLKNKGNGYRWLLIRVGNSAKLTTTSLHALVTVKTSRFKMMRRVGSSGTSSSSSVIETVHFGLKDHTSVMEVTVRWKDGSSVSKYNVPSNQLITFGRF